MRSCNRIVATESTERSSSTPWNPFLSSKYSFRGYQGIELFRPTTVTFSQQSLRAPGNSCELSMVQADKSILLET